MKRASIVTEVKVFFDRNDCSAAELSRASGVSPVIISCLRTGARKDVRSATADALRNAMGRIANKSAESEDCHASEPV